METGGYLTTERATFGTRFLAALIDGIIVGLVSAVFSIIGVPLIGLLISIGYYTYFEGGESGQTIGKRAMNIRVADVDTGASIGYARGAIPIGLCYFWMLWDDNSQTWHDKLAACVVVPTETA